MLQQPVTFPTAAVSATRFIGGLSKEIEGTLDLAFSGPNAFRDLPPCSLV
jgi:hypothetical protein